MPPGWRWAAGKENQMKIVKFEYTDNQYELQQVIMVINSELSENQIEEIRERVAEHCEENQVEVDDGYIFEVVGNYFDEIGIEWSGIQADYTINFD